MLRLALLWRPRRIIAIETDLFQIQPEIPATAAARRQLSNQAPQVLTLSEGDHRTYCFPGLGNLDSGAFARKPFEICGFINGGATFVATATSSAVLTAEPPAGFLPNLNCIGARGSQTWVDTQCELDPVHAKNLRSFADHLDADRQW
jgi:hypothetical protein